MDTHALVSDLAIGEKVQSLKGHQVQVTGIALDGLDIATSSIAWQWTKKDRVDHTRVHHFVTLSLTVSIKLSPVVHQPLELVAEPVLIYPENLPTGLPSLQNPLSRTFRSGKSRSSSSPSPFERIFSKTMGADRT
ncbi:unnamed protein product [Ilex paraguariensis]